MMTEDELKEESISTSNAPEVPAPHLVYKRRNRIEMPSASRPQTPVQTPTQTPVQTPTQTPTEESELFLEDTTPSLMNVARAQYTIARYGSDTPITGWSIDRVLNVLKNPEDHSEKERILAKSFQVLARHEKESSKFTRHVIDPYLYAVPGAVGHALGNTAEFVLEGATFGLVTGVVTAVVGTVVAGPVALLLGAFAGGYAAATEHSLLSNMQAKKEGRTEDIQSVKEIAIESAKAGGYAVGGVGGGMLIKKGVSRAWGNLKTLGNPKDFEKDYITVRKYDNSVHPKGPEHHAQRVKDLEEVNKDLQKRTGLPEDTKESTVEAGKQFKTRKKGTKAEEVLRAKVEEEIPPEVEGAMRAKVEGEIPPEMEGAMRPKVEGEIPPEIEGAMRPKVEGEIPPEMEGAMRPKVEGEIPPEMEGAMRPKVEGEIPPKVEGEIPPKVEGEIPPKVKEVVKKETIKPREYEIGSTARERYAEGSYAFYTSDLSGEYKIEIDAIGKRYKYDKSQPVASEAALHYTLLGEHKAFIKELLKNKGAKEAWRYLYNMYLSVEKGQVALRSEMRAGLAKGVNNTKWFREDIKFLKSGSKEAYVALYNYFANGQEIDQAFKIGMVTKRRLSKDTMTYIKNMKREMDKVPGRFAELGHAMGYLKGYVSQSHNVPKMLQTSFAEWYAFTAPKVRIRGRTLGGFKKHVKKAMSKKSKIPGKELKGFEGIEGLDQILAQPGVKGMKRVLMKVMYDNIIDSYGSFEKGGSGIPSKFKKHRVLHFVDAEAHLEYAMKYGSGHSSLISGMEQHLLSTAKVQAMLNNFGPRGFKLAQDLFTYVKDKTKEPPPKIKQELVELAKGQVVPSEFQVGQYGYYIENAMHKMFDRSLAANYEQGFISSLATSFTDLGKQAVLKNAFLWTLTEDLINSSIEKVKLGKAKKTATNTEFFKKLKTDKAFRDEFMKANSLYDFDKHLLPDNVVFESPYKTVRALRKMQEVLARVQMTDWLALRNKKVAAHEFMLDMGMKINAGAEWGSLKKYYKDILRSSGIAEKDWNYLIKIKQKAVAKTHPFWTEQELAHMEGEIFSITKFLNSEKLTRYEKNLGRKMLIAEATYVEGASVESSGLTTSMMFGDVTNRMVIGYLRGLKEFQGYNAKRIALLLSRGGWESQPGWVMSILNYTTKRMAIGFAHYTLKQLMLGRVPDLTTSRGIMNALVQSANDGGLLPYLGDIIGDYLHNEGYTFKEKLATMAGTRAVGAGATYWMDMGRNMYQLIDAIKNHENDKIVKYTKRLLPGVGWVPTDFIANRFIIDPYLKDNYPGAHNYFYREKERLAENYVKEIFPRD